MILYASDINQQHSAPMMPKSCYDQITLQVAALCLCRLGGTQQMDASMITTLHEMEHHIQTIYGNSSILASQTTWQLPIMDIGEGNNAGLHIWVAVSSPMLDIMCEDGFYAHMIGTISHLNKMLVGFAFVDDTDLCVHGSHINSKNIYTKTYVIT